MKAISLWQPFATAIAIGAKRYETRDWPPPGKLIGQEIAIHAALTDDKRTREAYARVAGHARAEGYDLGAYEDLPRGCIVATATIAGVVDTRTGLLCVLPEGDELEEALGDWSPQRWAWRLEPVRRIARDVAPCAGRQKLWELDDGVSRAIRAALGGA